MDNQIVAVYCLCDDLLKALYHHEDRQCQMSDTEVMTLAIIAMLYFRGNFETARRFLHDHGYIPKALSKSRLNRRLHRTSELFLNLFSALGETWKTLNGNSIYIIDSFPIAACDNYRICRSKRYRGEAWRGRQSSTMEDIFQEAQRCLLPLRKSNSKRPVMPWVHYLQASYRKVIETTGSMIEELLPKSIHAVTARGFEMKLAIFVLACSINYLFW